VTKKLAAHPFIPPVRPAAPFCLSSIYAYAYVSILSTLVCVSPWKYICMVHRDQCTGCLKGPLSESFGPLQPYLRSQVELATCSSCRALITCLGCTIGLCCDISLSPDLMVIRRLRVMADPARLQLPFP
jgi:hypothetical protein